MGRGRTEGRIGANLPRNVRADTATTKPSFTALSTPQVALRPSSESETLMGLISAGQRVNMTGLMGILPSKLLALVANSQSPECDVLLMYQGIIVMLHLLLHT